MNKGRGSRGGLSGSVAACELMGQREKQRVDWSSPRGKLAALRQPQVHMAALQRRTGRAAGIFALAYWSGKLWKNNFGKWLLLNTWSGKKVKKKMIHAENTSI